MKSACKCALFLLLGTPKFGGAIRSEVQDLVVGVTDDLEVMYKYCYGAALKRATLRDREDPNGGGKAIEKTKDEDSFIVVQNTFLAFRMPDFTCDLRLTDKPENQHEVDVSDDLKSAEVASGYAAYKYRPEKTWFELSVNEDEKAALAMAVKRAYVHGFRYKKNGFYAHSWKISGACGTEASGPFNERCEELLKSGEGFFRFTAVQGDARDNSDSVHINDDGERILPASEVLPAFKVACKGALIEWDQKFAGIAEDVCSGTKMFRPDDVEWSGSNNFKLE